MVEDEHSGSDLVRGTAKTLRRLLKGTAAEAAVPALLAARDSCLAAEAAAATGEAAGDAEVVAAAEAEAAAAEAAAAPGCQICFEAYGSVPPSLKLEPLS
jgi:hypothetical protein